MRSSAMCLANVREYRKGNKKGGIQINWQHRVHRMKKTTTKAQYNVCFKVSIILKTILMRADIYVFLSVTKLN
jgi:hypothetical protein